MIIIILIIVILSVAFVVGLFLSSTVHENSPRKLTFLAAVLSAGTLTIAVRSASTTSILVAGTASLFTVLALAILSRRLHRFFKNGDLIHPEPPPLAPEAKQSGPGPASILDPIIRMWMRRGEERALADTPPDSYCAIVLPTPMYRGREYPIRVTFSRSFLTDLPGYDPETNRQILEVAVVSQVFDAKPEKRSIPVRVEATSVVSTEFLVVAKKSGRLRLRIDIALNGQIPGYREEIIFVRINIQTMIVALAALTAFVSTMIGILTAFKVLP